MDIPMKGLWLVPSRRRLAKLQMFFDKSMENGMSTPGVVLVQKAEFDELKGEYAKLVMPKGWSVVATNGEGMGDKCREVWPAIQKLDWVGLGVDDLRPQTPGWDRILLSRINGKNIVTCNDGQQGSARMSGITMFSGGLLRAMGYLYAPHFWHTYMDNVWEDLGRATGCWTYVDEVLITHDHPFKAGNAEDETHKKSYGQQQRDQQAYVSWKANDFAGVCERIKKLQENE